MNVDLNPGCAHGLHNDVKLSLSAVQFYGFWLSCTYAFNLAWGPDRDERRYHQSRQATVALRENPRILSKVPGVSYKDPRTL